MLCGKYAQAEKVSVKALGPAASDGWFAFFTSGPTSTPTIALNATLSCPNLKRVTFQIMTQMVRCQFHIDMEHFFQLDADTSLLTELTFAPNQLPQPNLFLITTGHTYFIGRVVHTSNINFLLFYSQLDPEVTNPVAKIFISNVTLPTILLSGDVDSTVFALQPVPHSNDTYCLVKVRFLDGQLQQRTKLKSQANITLNKILKWSSKGKAQVPIHFKVESFPSCITAQFAINAGYFNSQLRLLLLANDEHQKVYHYIELGNQSKKNPATVSGYVSYEKFIICGSVKSELWIKGLALTSGLVMAGIVLLVIFNGVASEQIESIKRTFSSKSSSSKKDSQSQSQTSLGAQKDNQSGSESSTLML